MIKVDNLNKNVVYRKVIDYQNMGKIFLEVAEIIR